jgi:hypothetical protein
VCRRWPCGAAGPAWAGHCDSRWCHARQALHAAGAPVHRFSVAFSTCRHSNTESPLPFLPCHASVPRLQSTADCAHDCGAVTRHTCMLCMRERCTSRRRCAAARTSWSQGPTAAESRRLHASCAGCGRMWAAPSSLEVVRMRGASPPLCSTSRSSRTSARHPCSSRSSILSLWTVCALPHPFRLLPCIRALPRDGAPCSGQLRPA